jgi:glutaredoxin 3
MNVVVFSTPTCGWCVKLKSYLKEQRVTFRDVDVSRDPRAAEDMVRKTGQMGVPQIWINSQAVVGFDKAKIDRLLGIGG